MCSAHDTRSISHSKMGYAIIWGSKNQVSDGDPLKSECSDTLPSQRKSHHLILIQSYQKKQVAQKWQVRAASQAFPLPWPEDKSFLPDTLWGLSISLKLFLVSISDCFWLILQVNLHATGLTSASQTCSWCKKAFSWGLRSPPAMGNDVPNWVLILSLLVQN